LMDKFHLVNNAFMQLSIGCVLSLFQTPGT
jgi:hypothetical protein